MSHEEAVKIDTQLAHLWEQAAKAQAKIESYRDSLARQIGLKQKVGSHNFRYYVETTDEIIELAEQALANDTMPRYEKEYVERYLDKIAEGRDEYKAARDLAEPLEAIYAEHQWQRFFLVQNTNGHIHKDMQCHTCNPRTRFSWLPALSGLTEKDAVEAHGTILCSHCFPSAPVEWTLGIQKEADPNECPNSGHYQPNPNRRRYLTCETCGNSVSITSTGKLRKHKKAA